MLYDLLNELERVLPSRAGVEICRLRSSSRRMDVPARHAAIDALLEARDPSTQILELRERLLGDIGVTLVASTPDQVYNLMRVEEAQHEPLFDLIAVDEASQMDVAHAILAFCAVAAGAAVMLVGDPKQLSPIHRAESPVSLENLVGSVYDFFADHHRVGHTMLEINYRSNARIVDFTRTAGYEPGLAPYSPDLRLNLLENLPATRKAPDGSPSSLVWSEHWADILDPNKQVCCFVYKEGSFSQWNPFEADAVACLAFLLFGRMASGLIGERDDAGSVHPPSEVLYDGEGFWNCGVRIVTPHRAQQGLVISRLADVFRPLGHSESLIRSAVDTVERFQGQQRDVMLATFALGDPDSIRDEDEFLYNLNRFNVMASRDRAKLIVLVTQEVVDHLSSDIETIHHSKLLKIFVESYCNQNREMPAPPPAPQWPQRPRRLPT